MLCSASLAGANTVTVAGVYLIVTSLLCCLMSLNILFFSSGVLFFMLMTSGGSLGFLGVFCTCPFVACFLLLCFGAVLFAAFSLSLSVSVSLSESASNRF